MWAGHTCGHPGGSWAAEDRQGILSQVQAGLSVWHKCRPSSHQNPCSLSPFRQEEAETDSSRPCLALYLHPHMDALSPAVGPPPALGP